MTEPTEYLSSLRAPLRAADGAAVRGEDRPDARAGGQTLRRDPRQANKSLLN